MVVRWVVSLLFFNLVLKHSLLSGFHLSADLGMGDLWGGGTYGQYSEGISGERTNSLRSVIPLF